MKKSNFLFILLLSLIFVLVVTVKIYKNYTDNYRTNVLRQCSGHNKENKYHYHATLQIVQDKQIIKIPANIGITGNCIHPLHTHDTTGLIHMDYHQKFDFTLGDFFDTMGSIFNDRQIGTVKATDGYKIDLNMNNRPIPRNYRDVILKDRDFITIEIIK